MIVKTDGSQRRNIYCYDAMVDAWKRIHLSPSQFKVLYSVLFDVSIWELCECVMVSVS